MGALCPLRNQECVYEKCAWYNAVNEECSISLIVKAILEASRR